jgi:hypothetical protein
MSRGFKIFLFVLVGLIIYSYVSEYFLIPWLRRK